MPIRSILALQWTAIGPSFSAISRNLYKISLEGQLLSLKYIRPKGS